MRGVKQAEIDVGREHGVVQKVLIHQHGVLCFAKTRQGVIQKMFERVFCLFWRHRKPEGFNVTKIIWCNALGHAQCSLA